MPDTAPVSLIIPTLNPEPEAFGASLESVATLDSPPAEVVVVDSTPGGARVDCPEWVLDTLDIDVIETKPQGIHHARHVGIDAAEQEYAWTIDDTTTVLTPDWTDRAVDVLKRGDAVAVGGVPARSVRGGVRDLVALAASVAPFPPGGWRLTFPTRLCSGSRCFYPGGHRGDDYALRDELGKAGKIVRDPDLRFADEFPTHRQKKAIGAGAAVGGAVALRSLSI